MVKTKVILLIFLSGLTLISAMNIAIDIPQSDQLEPKDYIQLQKIQQLRVHFTEQLQNVSLKDISDLPEGRVPSAQDLQCLADMSLWMNGISKGSLWSLRMIDAWGSKPAGILSFNLIDMGNYEQCLKINKLITYNHVVHGQYCLAKMRLTEYLALRIGVCFPSSCSASNINTALSRVIKQLLNTTYSGELVAQESCKTSEKEPLEDLTIFMIVLLSVFGALALLATLYDYFICTNQARLPVLIKIFSIRATSRALFRVTNPKTNPNVIDCLHGMRCLSLCWVVYGHEYMFATMQPNINAFRIYDWIQSPYQNIIMHGVFSVDTFFFLSGLLVIMIALRAMTKSKGKLNVPMMYLHRYLRLAPLVGIAILVYMQLLPLLLDAPLTSNGFSSFAGSCQRTWYWTMLFVQNYATDEICLGHTWYLGVDMQLYLISPIFLFALYKWGKKAAYAIIGLIVLLSIWLFTVMLVKEYSLHVINSDPEKNAQKKLYFATHMHATPWLVGGVFGYFLHSTRGKPIKLHKIAVWAGWLICLATLFACLFALVPYDKFSGPKLPILNESFYYTLTRIAWPIALCWVVFACMHGYGGMADSFLSSPLWQPLSKLSYSVYVWHIFMQEYNSRRLQTNSYFSDYQMMINFWATFGFTVLIAYATYVTIEAPLGGLENLLLSPRKPNTPVEKTQEFVEEKPSVLQKYTDIEAAPTAASTTTITTIIPNPSE